MIEQSSLSASAVIFVVDDDCDMRDSLVWLLQSEGFAVQAFAGPREFLAQFDPERHGCLVCDVRMPHMTGIELYERLHLSGAVLPVLFMTAHADYPSAVRAFRAGAVDFLEKPMERRLLLERVRSALERDRECRDRRERWKDVSTRMSTLTEREREVLTLLTQGVPNKSIAARLGIGERAVELRRSSLMKRLEVTSTAELVRLATEFEMFAKLADIRSAD